METIAGMNFGVNQLLIISIITLIGILIMVLWLLIKAKKKARQSEEVNNKLLGAIDDKNRFFSILAHDLKSPFNSLLGLSEMLVLHSELVNNQEVKSYSKMMHQTTVKLYTLVDELLQWSQTQMGTIKYSPEKIDINILTTNIVNLLRLAAQEKDIVLAIKLDADLVANADSNIFCSILRNLLNNAVKFSPVGSTIQVKGRKVDKNTIELEVKDNGIGMSAEQIENIFKFNDFRTTTGTFNEKGTGLGLILCKEFVEMNKGEIRINSALNKGTSVIFTVPAFKFGA